VSEAIEPSIATIPEAFDFLFTPARIKGAHGGRGGAKSHSFGHAALILGYQSKKRIVCLREVQRSIRDSIKALLDIKINATPGFGFAKGQPGFYRSTDQYIRGANGTLITFEGLSGTADTVRSLEGADIAIVDEANDVSGPALETLIPTIRQPGSELWFAWNPRDPKDPIDKMLRSGEQRPDAIVREINFDQNPFFPDVLRAEMEWDRAHDPEKYLHVWRGQYRRNSQARVFKNWRVASRAELRSLNDQRSPIPYFLDVPVNARPFHGADWGFSTDPSVLVRCYIVGRKLYVDREVYRLGCEIDNLPAMFAQMPGVQGVNGAPAWPITADSSRPDTIVYMQRRNFSITGAKKGPGSIEDGVEFLRSYEIIVHPDCPHTIDELSLYSYKIDKITKEVLPQLEDKKNHVIDSLRYSVEGTRKVQTQQVRANIMGR